jgi:hypothetical protein
MNETQINYQATKVATALTLSFGTLSWGDLASILACIYTIILIGEWLWKKLRKPKKGEAE